MSVSLRHAISLLGLGLAVTLDPASAFATTVAVLPLEKGAASVEYDGLGVGLAGMITSDLVGLPGLTLVERQQMTAILAEIQLGKDGFLDPATAARAGRGLGADLLVTGSYSVIGETLALDVRVVGVARGQVVDAASASGSVEDFVALEKQLVEDLLDDLGAALDPKSKRLFYTRTPTEIFGAFVAYTRALSEVDRGELDRARAAFDEALAKDPSFEDALRSRADLAAMLEQQRAAVAATRSDERAALHRQVMAGTVDPRSRKGSAPWSAAEIVGLPVRWAALLEQGLACERLAEMERFLEQTDWRPESAWKNHFPSHGAYASAVEAEARRLGWTTLPGAKARPPAVTAPLRQQEVALFQDITAFVHHTFERLDALHAAGLGFTQLQCQGPARAAAATQTWVKNLEQRQLVAFRPTGPRRSGLDQQEQMLLLQAWFEAEDASLSAATRARLQAFIEAVPSTDPNRAARIERVQVIASHADHQESWRAHQLGYDLDRLRAVTEGIAEGAAPFRASVPLCAAEGSRGWVHEARRSLAAWDKDLSDGSRPFHPVSWAARLGRTAGAMGCIEGERTIATDWPQTRRFAIALAARPHPAPPNSVSCGASRDNLLQLAAIPDDSPAGPPLVSQALQLGFTLIQLRCLVEDQP